MCVSNISGRSVTSRHNNPPLFSSPSSPRGGVRASSIVVVVFSSRLLFFDIIYILCQSSPSSSSSPALFLCLSFSNEQRKEDGRRRKKARAQILPLFFCVCVWKKWKKWDFCFPAHRERAKKNQPRGKKKSIGVRRTRRTKKKESAQPGARTQDLSLTMCMYTRVFLVPTNIRRTL